jgi:hypothetical protein
MGMITELGRANYNCAICGEHFKNWQNYENHMRKHKNTSLYPRVRTNKRSYD